MANPKSRRPASRKPVKATKERHVIRPHANEEDSLALAKKVARLYYVEDQSLAEIADVCDYSIPTIARALQKARDAGIVQIIVQPEDVADSVVELGNQLAEHFRKQTPPVDTKFVIVPGEEFPWGPYDKETGRRSLSGSAAVAMRVAKSAADFLSGELKRNYRSGKDDCVIVGGGDIVLETARFVNTENLGPRSKKKGRKGLRVAALHGFFTTEFQADSPFNCAAELAKRTGGVFHWMPAPGLLRQDIQLIEKRWERAAEKKWEKLTIEEKAIVLLKLPLWESEFSDEHNTVTKHTDLKEQTETIQNLNSVTWSELRNSFSQNEKISKFLDSVVSTADRMRWDDVKVACRSESVADIVLGVPGKAKALSSWPALEKTAGRESDAVVNLPLVKDVVDLLANESTYFLTTVETAGHKHKHHQSFLKAIHSLYPRFGRDKRVKSNEDPLTHSSEESIARIPAPFDVPLNFDRDKFIEPYVYRLKNSEICGRVIAWVFGRDGKPVPMPFINVSADADSLVHRILGTEMWNAYLIDSNLHEVEKWNEYKGKWTTESNIVKNENLKRGTLNSILVVGGDPEKALPTYALLKAGFVITLVTDSTTARQILEFIREDKDRAKSEDNNQDEQESD